MGTHGCRNQHRVMRAVERRRMYGGKSLPYDAEVEYLESTGTQWIDTGIKGKNTTTFDVRFIPLELPDGRSQGKGTILGNRYSYNNRVFHLSTFTNLVSSKGTFAFGSNGWNSGNTPTLDLSVGEENRIIKTNEIISTSTSQSGYLMKINGRYSVCYGGSFVTPYTITVFAIRSDNKELPMTEFIKMRLLSLRIDDLDLIPVIKDSIPCMYDKVSGELFYNQGTGQFIAGPVISGG